MGFISPRASLYLTDGTAVSFVKTTSKGNLQVRLPEGHPFAVGQDAGRIFKANGGAHYKGLTELRLTNSATATTTTTTTAPTPTPVAAGQIDTTKPIFASDGTPVTFVKVTPKRGLIQVRFPDSHAFAAGQGNGRLYLTDGTRTGLKVGRKNGYVPTITNDASASASTAPVAAAAAPVADTTGSFALVSASGSMLADGFDTKAAAVGAAASYLADGSPISVVQVTTTVVATVGITVTDA